MHIDVDRFDLDAVAGRHLDAFQDYFFYNSELCSECFTQIREIDKTQQDDLAPTSLKNRPQAVHERTHKATCERSGFGAPSERYGTTFCTECGAEAGTRWSDTRPLEALKQPAKRILVYTIESTPYDVDGARMGRELRRLKKGPGSRERVGRDMQCLAVAWARAVESG